MNYSVPTAIQLELTRSVSLPAIPGETKREAMARAKASYAIPGEPDVKRGFEVKTISYSLPEDDFDKLSGKWEGEMSATVLLHGDFPIESSRGEAKNDIEQEFYETGGEIAESILPILAGFSMRNSSNGRDAWYFNGETYVTLGEPRIVEQEQVNGPALVM